jgi:hypothetical protein
LPPLRGRTGAVARTAHLALLALTLFALAVGTWMSARDLFITSPNNLAFGFVTSTGSSTARGVRQVRVHTPTSEAARASGLRRDDIILSIDGTRVPPDAAEHDIGRLTGAVRGDVATIVTRSVDGAIRTHRLPRQADAWSAEITGTGLTGWERSALLFGTEQLRLLLVLAAAILLFQRRSRDPVALLFATSFLMFCHMSGSGAWFWYWLGIDNARHFVSIILYTTLVLALNAFPDGRFVSRWTAALALVGAPIILLLWIAGWQWRLISQGTLAICSSAILLATIAGLVLRYRRLSPGPERQQIKWAVFGFTVAILISAIVSGLSAAGLFFQPNQGAASFVAGVAVTTLCWLLFPLGLLVSLLRFRLYDAETAISRSASYSFLTVLLVTGFAATKKGIELVGEQYFEGSAAIFSGGAAAAAAALMITPLHRRVMSWAEQRFQKALIALRRKLPDRVGDLRETATLEELADEVVERVQRGVRASRAALIVGGAAIASRDADPALIEESAALLPEAGEQVLQNARDRRFPVRVRLEQGEGESPAWLLLGPRPDGSLYGRDEREALSEIADPVARAIRIVRQRAAAAQAQEAVVSGLKAEVSALKKRLSGVERRLRPSLTAPAVAAE